MYPLAAGNRNTLRYRGYYYDSDTGFYYLQSRYYDPTTCRFLNADSYASTGQGIIGHNMFAYCNDNPVSNVDPTGHALMQASFDPDGASSMLCPGPWGGGSGSCGVAYAASVFTSIAKDSYGWLYYKSNGDKKGAKICDSYKVRIPIVMYVYLAAHRGDEISGTTTGAVIEWIAHNIAYDAGWVLNALGETDAGQNMMKRGRDLDIGSTIYDDLHYESSVGMWGGYFIIAPVCAIIDIVIEVFE